MLRRFGLAHAFLFEPDLVLLDEPTAGLDAPGLVLLEQWISEHRARGGSLVLSSHSLSDLIEHTDRMAVLWQGRLATEGATREELVDPGKHRIEWQGLENVAACVQFLEEQGASEVHSKPAWKSLFRLYRELQERMQTKGESGA